MQQGRRIIVLLLAVLTGTTAGCAGRFWGMRDKPSNLPTEASAPTSGAPALEGKTYEELSQQYKQRSLVTPSNQAQAVDALDNSQNSISFASTVRKATDAVTDALTIQPKVIPAEDPLRLSSDPGPISPDVYTKAAQLMETQGNAQGAMEQYRKALEVAPNDEKSLLSFARLYDRMGNFEEAIAHYRRAIEAHPQSAIAHNDLGLCFARRGDNQQALASLQQAVALNPKQPLYRNNIAKVLIALERGQEAIRHQTAVHPPAVAHYNVGVLMYGKGDRPAALQHFTRASELDPSLAAARNMVHRMQAAGALSEAFQRSGRSPLDFGSKAPPSRPAPPPAPVKVQRAADDWGDAPSPESLYQADLLRQQATSPRRETTGPSIYGPQPAAEAARTGGSAREDLPRLLPPVIEIPQ